MSTEDVLADGVRRRLADVAAAADRLDAFAFVPGETAGVPTDGPARDAARDLMLRALRCAADPVCYRLLRRLRSGDAAMVELAKLVELPRLAVWERINDLTQVGLVVRSHRGDEVGLTPGGGALVDLIERTAEIAAPGDES